MEYYFWGYLVHTRDFLYTGEYICYSHILNFEKHFMRAMADDAYQILEKHAIHVVRIRTSSIPVKKVILDEV